MADITVVDRFKGVPYSQIMESLSSEDRKKYVEKPHPMIKVPGTGQAEYCTSIGRWVV